MKSTFTSELFSFAYFNNYQLSIDNLATLAENEPWDFSDSIRQNKSILKSYLEHTYRKLKNDNQVTFSQDNRWACFNTGLMTGSLESIFALFEQNKLTVTNGTASPFFFKSFVKESDYSLISHFQTLPEPANYFANPEDLIFNPRIRVVPQIDHIIEDNIDRFPLHMRNLPVDEKRRRLIGAIDEAQKKVRTNYKLAVPQYYNGRIQLLLPLCLTPGSPNPDLALVTHRIGDCYTARTCLTLKMAYSNARLIVKPQSSWLHV